MIVLNRLLFVLFFFCTTAMAQECDGPYAGQKLTRNQLINHINDQQKNFCGAILDGIDLSDLNLHQTNFAQASMKLSRLNSSDLSRANLTAADLSYAQLHQTNLRWANLTHADLSSTELIKTNLQEAKLAFADLSRSKIQASDFTKAILSHSNLSGVTGHDVKFNDAKLNQADLQLSDLRQSHWDDAQAKYANFSNTTLHQNSFDNTKLNHALFINANLNESSFIQSQIDQANFQQANFKNVYYQPFLDGLPLLEPLATSLNFSTLKFNHAEGAPALKSLSMGYRQLGMQSMTRVITSMVKEQKMWANFDKGGWHWFEGAFHYVLFYTTCDFGLAPTRPLLIVFIIMLGLIIPYHMSLCSRSPYAGIVVHWASRKNPVFVLEASYQHIVKFHQSDPWIEKFIKHYRTSMTATYFSLLSSVRIGWKDFNLAHWLSFIQTREYELRPRGWVRSLSGLQSILSAYLIVLWALTYFSTPFQW